MPPRKRRKPTRSKPEENNAQGPILLEDLPLVALALIYQHLDNETRKSVLRVSRWGRNLVLREVKAISLELQSRDKATASKPLVRLLGRAISTATPGLSLEVDAAGTWQQPFNGQLPAIVRQAAELPGWASIRELRLKVGFRVPACNLSAFCCT
jgi:hypothetical protein